MRLRLNRPGPWSRKQWLWGLGSVALVLVVLTGSLVWYRSGRSAEDAAAEVVDTTDTTRRAPATTVAPRDPTTTASPTTATTAPTTDASPPPETTTTTAAPTTDASPPPETTTAAPSVPPSAPPPPPPADTNVGPPRHIEIPAIGVEADVTSVGLKRDGGMETPTFGLAGWYEPGPTPGAPGPSVIVAHVDSKQGPDVFSRLRELSPGDEIIVTGAEGEKVTFAASSSETIAKTALPVDRIWNDTPDPALRLVTCGGSFDEATGHYRSNVIVYANDRV